MSGATAAVKVGLEVHEPLVVYRVDEVPRFVPACLCGWRGEPLDTVVEANIWARLHVDVTVALGPARQRRERLLERARRMLSDPLDRCSDGRGHDWVDTSVGPDESVRCSRCEQHRGGAAAWLIIRRGAAR